MQDQSRRSTGAGDIDYRQLVPLLLLAGATQTIISLIRVTTSYRIVELGLSEIWVGVIAGSYAIVPIFTAVWVGRYVDRNNDARATQIGTWVLALAAAVFYLSPGNAPWLMAGTITMGIAFLYQAIGLQVLCVRICTLEARDTVIGHYMVANALGQGLGPLVVGWVGGSAKLPPTEPLFGLALAVGVLSLAAAHAITPDRSRPISTSVGSTASIPELLRMPGLPTMIFASIIIIASQDLIAIYLPVWGTERGVGVYHVGMLLMVRSIASMAARLLYPSMVRLTGRMPLTVVSMAGAGVAYALIVLPLPLAVVYIAVAASGFGLGIAATLSISNTMAIAPADARGVVLSLRITGNRLGQVTMPLLGGVIAAATGAGAIFLVLAVFLWASATSVEVARRRLRM